MKADPEKSPREIIISHPGTDFDSLASMWAAHLLVPKRPIVMIAGADTNVREFLALYGQEFPRLRLKDLDIGAVKSLTVVDCSSRSQLARIEGLLDNPGVTIELWDHHRAGGPDFRVNSHHYAPVGANTTLLVQELIRQGIVPSPVAATLLMLGIHEDTGSLRFSSTTPDDLDAAAWLLKAGAALDMVDRFLGIRLSPTQKRLLTALSLNVRVTEVKGIPIHLTRAVATEFVEEIAFLTRKVQETESADVIFSLVELNGRVFIVGRSRIPAVDVGRILSAFGGGGHAQAGSCLLAESTHPIALQRLLDAIREEVHPSVVARDIMSRPVHSIDPGCSIAKAGEVLARLGHSGLAVVDDGNHVLGVITRREVDKAVGHDLGHAPVRGYMRRDPVIVSEETGLGEIQNLIIDRRTGFIPVVFGGKLSGVVTRTDVLRALHKASTAPGEMPGRTPLREAEEAGNELIARLSPSHIALLAMAGEAADSLNVTCYLVGGIIRDLVLDRPNVDIDLLIEGDGGAFANKLAENLDARIHENPRFRTAKIILPDGGHIDVATAREEFYVQPGALPTVEAAGIRDDLVRRDFTINTLALQLNSRAWGLLIDHFGGLSDIKSGLIRVLHTFSFVDDPTRILRGLRFSARYGFELEDQTGELLRRALLEGRLDDVSPERIRDELFLCLHEDEPWQVLSRICEMGVFGVLHHGVHPPMCLADADDPVREALNWLAEFLPDEDMPRKDLSYLAFLLSHTDPNDAVIFVSKYKFDGSVHEMVEALTHLPAAQETLRIRELTASDLAERLHPLHPSFWVVLAAETAAGSPERKALRRFLEELRVVHPVVDGDDFISEGYTPGPLFRKALAAIRKAKLDGKISTRDEEMGLARSILGSK